MPLPPHLTFRQHGPPLPRSFVLPQRAFGDQKLPLPAQDALQEVVQIWDRDELNRGGGGCPLPFLQCTDFFAREETHLAGFPPGQVKPRPSSVRGERLRRPSASPLPCRRRACRPALWRCSRTEERRRKRAEAALVSGEPRRVAANSRGKLPWPACLRLGGGVSWGSSAAGYKEPSGVPSLTAEGSAFPTSPFGLDGTAGRRGGGGTEQNSLCKLVETGGNPNLNEVPSREPMRK